MVLLLLVLILCSALISGSEVAYFSLLPDEIQKLQESNDAASRRALQLKKDPRGLLAVILIANNLVNVAIVILSDQLVWQFFGMETFSRGGQWLSENLAAIPLNADQFTRTLNFLVTVVGVTVILVLFGEITPKIYATTQKINLAKFMSKPLTILHTLFSPFRISLVGWSERLEKVLRNSRKGDEHKTEIEEAIEMTVSGDVHAEKEVDILKSIIKMDEVPVKQIMRSRVDVIAESTESSLEQVLQTIRESGYSRIPVYKESLDEIAGLLYAKDLVGFDKEQAWTDLIRKEIHYVPETKRINELLKEFQIRHQHMALVVDEYGGVSGLVTLEDVMEEVIGEIQDEFDEGSDIEYTRLDDRTYIFEGKSLLNDVCRVMNIELDEFDDGKGEADSIAGLMLEITGQIPRQYQEVRYKDYTLRAERVSKRRIERVRIRMDKS